ncbi:hypothetical protein C343_05916 [Cryptococcus neoformans C23]|uniref:Uncharacterized protein n=2 Tax=Cryptococcus neoformans TaxID=5207 RepID=J9VTI4_CRYN9|nr:hypothetical protein CNAG_01562 [Cryptococcus neoformans var. grubii H99]XP_012052601.1 hypothetical protein, variant [Cryptococcus neoformans var. grubii H99]OWZ27531.1 hypothetical protein C347_05955 [Cryptococcus neoformans var. grubii AD2-60a]OWZ32782.1 hypothetical protein C353_05816 [Cryptococcus neoformans var. grubii AD1-83a]OWZ39835.1 hypothetical protein C343_05916 [Cryptococcus neoformans var. grubii C23]OWZ50914.1 hypothetical protein C368_06070 [Cryptococcus neoformans var. gru|eukprot:XP_012052371.1 hypothetical protein CNAG_01562 [Cryptococcus neoformans var. grubii H99]
MFAKAAVIALASASIVAAAPVNCARAKPTTYDEGYLESYDSYHARYLALSCYSQHNTTFFDDCCHPLLATETLADNRASYCTPNSTAVASVNATIAEATASATASADIEAESQYNNASSYAAEATAPVTTSAEATAPVTASAEATASVTAAAVNNVAEVAQQSASASSEEEQPTASSSSSYGRASASSSSSEEESTSTSSSSASDSSSTSSSQVYTGGYATFFSQGGVAGECGTVHSDDDYVIAIDSNGWWQDYESNDSSPYCGKHITLTNTNNGKSVTAVVADVCPTCETANSLDLSIGAFNQIATEEDGMVPITWYFTD